MKIISITDKSGKKVCAFSILKTSSGDDVKHGIETWWHSNGRKQKQMTWKHSKLDGPHTEWHENGKVKTESHYKNGLQDGKYNVYDSSGKLLHSSVWKAGKSNSLEEHRKNIRQIMRSSIHSKDLLKNLLNEPDPSETAVL